MPQTNRIANREAALPLCPELDPGPRRTVRAFDSSWTVEPRPGSRLTVPLPVVVIPVRPDGRPDRRRWSGSALAIGPAGITLALDELHGPLTPTLIVGVQTSPSRTQYAGVEVLSASPPGDRLAQVLGLFGGPADEVLQPRNLTPRFHFDSMTFTFGLPGELLHGWEEAGVLQAMVIDRLLLCPRCHGLPTFRSGCRKCGSGRVVQGRSSHPEDSQSVPLPSSYQCEDCHWSDSTLQPINHCLYCEHRFATHQAYEMVLLGYHAHRLDPRSLAPAEQAQ
jgi:hypothetical protein